ncbi:MAG: radical SAM protein [Streptosporangiaceae bacterium]|nr:radical SAM protein [Streptosporangiaceae bacterium]
MHELIVSPFLGTHLVLRPGQPNAIRISRDKYAQLQSTGPDGLCPNWLSDAVIKSWRIDVSDRPLRDFAILRAPSLLGYGRASYELNMGCNYDCKHCYLGLKEFAGLEFAERGKILGSMRDAGVLWLQLTGGEPTIDRLFPDTYATAFDLGMMIEVLTNGSRLSNPAILDLLTSCPPHRVTLSVYGATEASYDGLTQRRGAYKSFIRGLSAAHEAGISLDLSIVITNDNCHEIDAMHALADGLGIKYRDYTKMSPTIYGGAETLTSQSLPHLTVSKPFTGCDAGHTSFHVDPHGRASICKVGREPNIALADEGLEGLHRLGGIADQLLRRQGGCSGCTLSAQCGTCMPLAAKYREADSPLDRYCQHKERR